MKRIFNLITLCIALSFFTVGCNDATDDISPKPTPADEEIVTKGLSVDLLDNTYEVPVKAEGKWTAAIRSDCKWAWLGQRFIVRADGEATSSKLWLTHGKLSADRYDNITYETARTHPHIVFDYGLHHDGSIGGGGDDGGGGGGGVTLGVSLFISVDIMISLQEEVVGFQNE